VVEFISTVNQSGAPQPPDPEDTRHPTWNDNYFNNWLYKMGWTYHNMTIGNPLITSSVFSNDNNTHENITNNRINAIHGGITGSISVIKYTMVCTWSVNKGTYGSTYIPAKKQSSLMLRVLYPSLFSGTDAGISFGLDKGNMYGNNYGIMFNLIKKICI